MKRIISLMVLVLLAAQSFAQEAQSPQKQEAEQPQIGYRILNDYVSQEQAKAEIAKDTWSWVSLGVGGVLFAGSAVTWFYGDQIAAGVGSEYWNPDTKTILTVSLAGAGAAAVGVGLIGFLIPPIDVYERFASVYSESDSIVQEAMAVAALKDLASRGRDARITGAIVGILVPVATLATQSIINVSTGKPWYDGYESVSAWQIPGIASSISDFFRLSSEERLYEKYLAARSAIYASQ
jgi:hypothetical protein